MQKEFEKTDSTNNKHEIVMKRLVFIMNIIVLGRELRILTYRQLLELNLPCWSEIHFKYYK